EIVFERVVRIAAESVAIRPRMLFRNARPERARQRALRVRLERQGVEGAQAHADAEPRRFGADAFDDLAHKARAVFQAAAIRSRPIDGAQELVAKIAMAMLHVDEIVAACLGALGRDDEVFDQPLDLVVADDGPILRIAELAVEQRVIIGNDGFELGIVIGLAEAARMRELQTDDDIAAVAAHGFLVPGDGDLAQAGDLALALRRHGELLGIGASIRAHRAGLAAPEQLGTAKAEAMPTPLGILRRL